MLPLGLFWVYVWFENINYPLVGLDLDGIDDADEHGLERSDNTGTLPNRFLIKIHIEHVLYVDLKILMNFLLYSLLSLSLSVLMVVIMFLIPSSVPMVI